MDGESKWVYENNGDNTARFILGEPGKKTLICIGINPSTAAPNDLDPTATNVRSICIKKGYDGWVLINLYPQRETNPDSLPMQWNQDLHEENMNRLEEYFSKYPPTHVWASWGNLIEKREYFKTCLDGIINIIEKHNSNWVNLGPLTVKGHPHHPSRISHDNEFDSFDINRYYSSLKENCKVNKRK